MSFSGPGSGPAGNLRLVRAAPRFPAAAMKDVEKDQEAPEKLRAAVIQHLHQLLSFLTKAARNSWELPTSQVEHLVGGQTAGDPHFPAWAHLPDRLGRMVRRLGGV